MNSSLPTPEVLCRVPFHRRLFSVIFNRRTFFVVLFLITLVMFFYAVENWRGKRAWEACKRELEAKGEVLDWLAYVPKPVPDDQNMMKVPLIESWFIRPPVNTNYLKRLQKLSDLKAVAKLTADRRGDAPFTLAEVVVLLPDSNTTPGPGDLVYSLSELTTGQSHVKLALEAIPGGRSVMGSQGAFLVVEKPFAQQPPLRLYLRADKLPKPKEIADLFNRSGILGHDLDVRAEPAASSRVFRLVPGHDVCVAADYLEWSDQFKPEFDIIREAARRPYARIDGNYNEPFTIPIANLVAVRIVSQVAAQRAQACLLLGRPEQAVRELALINEVRRYVDSSQPVLVAAMINQAVAGLYASVIEEGFHAGVWQEPQWASLQEQLRQINLLPGYAHSFRGGERAGVIHALLETYPRKKLAKLFVGGEKSVWKKPLGLYILLCPRGWLYQNAAVVARVEQAAVEWVDVDRQRVDVGKLAEAASHIESDVTRSFAYTFVAGAAVPNFGKAVQATTKHQTFVNEAMLGCALERCRQATGAYPESLEALVPKFVDKLPHDIFNGQPLHYRRTDNGGYALWSVGWDLKDDGGKSGPQGRFDSSAPDWVWTGGARK